MVSLSAIQEAQHNINEVVELTPLDIVDNLSEAYDAHIYFKREDLQVVRSYKIRGAYNRIKKIHERQTDDLRVVCASAGNHAQGVALACHQLSVRGVVFMPVTTPLQKLERVKMFGRAWVDVVLKGDTYDDSYAVARDYCKEHQSIFVHPFNDPDVIAGQGTVGLEILNQFKALTHKKVDYLFLPIGGGGLASGVGLVFKTLSPETKIIGVEPKGAPSFKQARAAGKPVFLSEIDRFVDGAAVQQMGAITFEMCNRFIDEVVTVDEGAICQTILKLYNENAMVVEPAGCLSITALNAYKESIVGKNVVCVVSGGNNDITRMEEMKERSLLYRGLKHYFLVSFPQRAGALREFLTDVLGPEDDITHFEYTKKNSRTKGPAVVGIQLKRKSDFEPLLERMKSKGFMEAYLNDKPALLSIMV